MQHILISLLMLNSSLLLGLKISSPSQSLGQLWQGSKVEFKYPLKNNSSRAVEVIGIHAECGCVIKKKIPHVIKPGEKSELQLTLDTTQFSGNLKKTISFMYKDKTIKTKLLSVSANIKTEFLVNPPVLLFDENQTKQSLTIVKKTAGTTLGELRYRHDWFIVKKEKASKGVETTYWITAKPAFLAGVSSSELSVSTDSQNLPSITLKALNTNKRNKLSELSEPIDFGFIKKGARVKREIPLGKLEGQHFGDEAQVYVADQRIQDHSKFFDYELIHKKRGKFLEVKISNVGHTFGFVRGKIKIRHKDGSLLYALNTVGYLSK